MKPFQRIFRVGPVPPAPRVASFPHDEDGTAMLEFVLIAPVLCYLMVGILFFRHHLDYAQDSVARYNVRTFAHIVPQSVQVTDQNGMATIQGALNSSGQASDEGGFGKLALGGIGIAGADIRTAVQLAGVTGISATAGYVLAAERYFNGIGTGTPYDRMNLKRQNYLTQYDPKAEMPEDPWSNILGGLGTYFGDRIGGGTYEAPEGLKQGWTERFPLIVDPWQRHFSSQLDARYYLVVGLVFELLNPLTFNRAGPNPRYDNRDTDIGESEFVDGGGSCDELQLEEESGEGTVWSIVK